MALPSALTLFACKAVLYQLWAWRAFSRKKGMTDSSYFGLEQKFTVAAIIFFSVDIYLLDVKYYIARLPLADSLPVLINTGGLSLFFFYLCLFWFAARSAYHQAFSLPPERHYTAPAFLAYNIKNNLPIVLPWLLITFLLDLFQLIPLPILARLPLSQWAEPAAFLYFRF